MKKTSAIADFFRALKGFPIRRGFTSAVIVAGGSSSRMGGVSKQMAMVNGIPVVARTLLAFEATDCIDEIVVVARKDEMTAYKKLRERYSINKLKRVVCGGSTRQESVKNGFDAISDKADYVAIHDAARCLVTPEIIESVCNSAYVNKAAIAATRAVDTVKISEGAAIISDTPDRSTVWQAQTPQVFSANLYRAAVYTADKENFEGTDDSSLVEHIKYNVKLVDCGRENIKITTDSDLEVASALLMWREAVAEKERKDKKK